MNAAITCGPLQYRAAEFQVEQRLRAIGLHCVSAIEGLMVPGPCGPSLALVILTTGKVWGRAAFIAVYHSAEMPIYWLTACDCMAEAEVIAEQPSLQFWKVLPRPDDTMHSLVEAARARFCREADYAEHVAYFHS